MKIFASFLIVILAMLATGCGTTHYATNMGARIGETYQEAAAMGTVSAKESIKAWPYVSGQIKGIFAANYDLEMPALAREIIDNLDLLAEKDELTDEEKGFVIGSFCRLEQVAIEYAWDNYGVSILEAVRGLMGG